MTGWGAGLACGAGVDAGTGSAEGRCTAGVEEEEAKACSGRGTLCTT